VRRVVLGLVLLVAACEPTTLEVVNRAGAATLERVRWVREDGGASIAVPGRILPGAASAPVDVHEVSFDREGTLKFELVVSGARVGLELAREVKVEAHAENVVEVGRGDAVVNATVEPR
jgi:hypothetical protein